MKELLLITIAAFSVSIHAQPNNKQMFGNICETNRCGTFPSFCNKSRYRSYDGSCNNLQNPHWGTAYSPYARFVENSYSDGINEIPRSCTNEPLMNPRLVSLLVFPDVIVKDLIWNVIALQWGQVVAHDMSFTADVPQTGVDDIVCCTNGEPVPPKSAYPNPRCLPIPLPCEDPYNAPEGNTCINFVRTLSSNDKNCYLTGKAVQQVRNYIKVELRCRTFTDNRQFTGQIRLSDWFNRPSIIEEDTCGLTRGLCTQRQNAADRYFDVEITQYFFREPNQKLGQDLRAIDIQRSRDHGIGVYIAALEKCGLGKPRCFSDLEKYMTRNHVKLLQRVYKNINDVELAVAGPLETPVNGTLVGPTFLCILLEQFYRTRVGDRFFYENGNTDGTFTPLQLKSIRKASMSRLLCDNVQDVKLIQPNAFAKISEKNSLVHCNTLPQVDLRLWKEKH